MNHKFRKYNWVWVVSFIIGLSAWRYKTLVDYFEISKNLDIFAEVYRKVNQTYVNEVLPGELIQVSIDAMLKSLDPYTNYYSEAQAEEFRLHATGSYNGIGLTLSNREGKIMVTNVFKGFPADKAGILVGDQIVHVNKQEITGKKTKDLAPLLNGSPGTEMVLGVHRRGKDKEFIVMREKVLMKNVTHAQQVSDDIIYIKLNGFSFNAAKEVEASIKKHSTEKDPKGIVIDLRGNGGGLLLEAIKIVNIFIDKNKLVVNTKGRLEKENITYQTSRTPIDTNVNVAILIDNNSASASEIVAGSLQDYDRAVVVGQRSFGKGLVQKPISLSYNTQMKITVSKYFLPSGRLIQELDYRQSNSSKKNQNRASYRTKNGRTVKSGQGIMPDILVSNPKAKETLETLRRGWLIFDFVTQLQKQYGECKIEFKMNDEDYAQFRKFINKKDSLYKSANQIRLEKLIAHAEQEKDNLELLKKLRESLEITKLLDSKKLDDYKPAIKREIEMEYVKRYWHNKGAVQNALNSDLVLEKTINILKNDSLYHKTLRQSHD